MGKGMKRGGVDGEIMKRGGVDGERNEGGRRRFG